MTPPAIARFIARGMSQDRDWGGAALRIIDPAAGSGVLAAALIEAIAAAERRPHRIELLLCEIDGAMLPLLDQCTGELTLLCRDAGIDLAARASEGDFLLGAAALSKQPVADAVIANPPYFKLARQDPRAVAHPDAVHGQPNIYALFMAACARILRPGGSFGFITPRSWTNGAYFRAARSQVRTAIAIDALHLFDSREQHFEADAVLQEALITWGTAGRVQGRICFSSSRGPLDLAGATVTTHAAAEILGLQPSSPIVLPEAPQRARDSMPFGSLLAELGLKVVTGPVVGFRASSYLQRDAGPSTVPLLWMQHVRRGSIQWPRGHRAEHIVVDPRSLWMLLPNEPCVLLRRFSPKEDVRRICAAAYAGHLPGAHIGFENHLNVIRGEREPLTVLAANGLAAWLNSRIVDAHLRRRLGSTQVNAAELRELPLPDLVVLEDLGRSLPLDTNLDQIDAAVAARSVDRTARAHAA